MLLHYTLLSLSPQPEQIELSQTENKQREGGEIIHKINTLAHSRKLLGVEKM